MDTPRIARGLAAAGALALAWFASRSAGAFCGFYVSGAEGKLFANASQVVLMREGTRTVLAMQNDYQGPPENFAMVVPVPVVLQKENVKTLPRDVFARVDTLDAPRLVEYWERDPCAPAHVEKRKMARGATGTPPPSPDSAAAAKDLGVTIEAEFTVGEYEIVILGAKDSAGLDTWLRREGYKIPDGSEPLLRPYVQQGSKFFVARVDVSKVKMDGGKATLSPLRFHYDAASFSLPIRLGLVNSSGTQDLVVHVLGKGKRYEVANYPNVTIPTNLDVAESAKAEFGSFYATLFDRTLAKNPRAIVTEYAWDAGSCDPCPKPPLTDAELVTLGADVLPSVSSETDLVDPQILRALGADAGVSTRPGAKPSPLLGTAPPPVRRRYYGLRSSFVLTRLHARYTKDAIGDDLVFREAPPIVGGREVRGGRDGGGLETGASPGSVNAFQGRYAVRHPWAGPVTCAEPIRGVWGGPPSGLTNGPARPALGLAYAPREKAPLASFLRSDVAALDVKAGGAEPSGVVAGDAPVARDAGASGAALAGDAGAGARADAGAGDARPASRSGCGACATTPTRDAAGHAAGAVTSLALLLWRLRRRARSESLAR